MYDLHTFMILHALCWSGWRLLFLREHSGFIGSVRRLLRCRQTLLLLSELESDIYPSLRKQLFLEHPVYIYPHVLDRWQGKGCDGNHLIFRFTRDSKDASRCLLCPSRLRCPRAPTISTTSTTIQNSVIWNQRLMNADGRVHPDLIQKINRARKIRNTFSAEF